MYRSTHPKAWSKQGFVGHQTCQYPGRLALVRLVRLTPPREFQCDVTLADDRERLKGDLSSSTLRYANSDILLRYIGS